MPTLPLRRWPGRFRRFDCGGRRRLAARRPRRRQPRRGRPRAMLQALADRRCPSSFALLIGSRLSSRSLDCAPVPRSWFRSVCHQADTMRGPTDRLCRRSTYRGLQGFLTPASDLRGPTSTSLVRTRLTSTRNGASSPDSWPDRRSCHTSATAPPVPPTTRRGRRRGVTVRVDVAAASVAADRVPPLTGPRLGRTFHRSTIAGCVRPPMTARVSAAISLGWHYRRRGRGRSYP